LKRIVLIAILACVLILTGCQAGGKAIAGTGLPARTEFTAWNSCAQFFWNFWLDEQACGPGSAGIVSVGPTIYTFNSAGPDRVKIIQCSFEIKDAYQSNVGWRYFDVRDWGEGPGCPVGWKYEKDIGYMLTTNKGPANVPLRGISPVYRIIKTDYQHFNFETKHQLSYLSLTDPGEWKVFIDGQPGQVLEGPTQADTLLAYVVTDINEYLVSMQEQIEIKQAEELAQREQDLSALQEALTACLNEKTTYLTEKNTCLNEKTTLKNTITSKDGTITTLQSQKAACDTNLAACDSAKSSLTKEKSQLQTQIQTLQTNLASCQAVPQPDATQTGSIQQLTARIAELEVQKTALNTQVDQLIANVAALNTQLQAANAEKQQIQQQADQACVNSLNQFLQTYGTS
jgi:hypothetical protein